MSSDLKKDPLVDSFLSSLRLEKGLSENTIKAYTNDCQAFIKWLFLNKRYEAVNATEEDVENYLKHFQSINLSNTTINRKISSLKHFFNHLSKKKLLKSNPIINISGLKSAKALPKSLSIIDVKSLIDAPDCSTFIGLRDRTMIELMYATGVRISELINLKYTNLDLNRSLIKVMGKGGKERMIPFGDDALSWLMDYIEFRRKNNLSLNLPAPLLTDWLIELLPILLPIAFTPLITGPATIPNKFLSTSAVVLTIPRSDVPIA